MSGNNTTNDKINIIELLMGIKEDVSSIKTDMTNFKEVQRTEKEMMMKEISDVRTDYKRDLSDLEAHLMGRINNMQSIQSSLVGDVDNLKSADDKKYANRWRKTMAFILTGMAGMLLAKLPDFITFCIKLSGE